jgi:methyl-accepting chemotaxis protein
MKKHLYSIRTTLSVTLALMLLISITTVSWLSISQTRTAYLDLSIRDIEYMSDLMVAEVDAIAKESNSEADFARNAGPIVNRIGEQYFDKNGMTGYAGVMSNEGAFVYHPRVQSGNMNDTTWGKTFLAKAQAVQFNGTIFYDWQNPGESAPRAKFGVIRKLPSKPTWYIAVTAYTNDDLLLPFRVVQNELIAIGVATVIISVLVTILLAGSLTGMIRRVQTMLARLAGGDLRTDHQDFAIVARRKDELGEMARSVRHTIDSLRTIVSGVTTSAHEISQAAGAMTVSSEAVATSASGAAQGAGQVASGSSEQALSAAEAGRTMAEFQQTISQIAAGAEDSASEVQRASDLLATVVTNIDTMASRAAAVAQAAGNSADSAARGAAVVTDTVSGMDRIRQRVGEAAGEIRGLSQLSAQITEITEVISEIADQTSLLALNAAIEAARAGEQGRGFAVVAEEVRRLADRSATSARHITDLVVSIQQQTARAVKAMETGTAEVDQGNALVANAGQMLAQIRELAQATAAEVTGITALTEDVRNKTQGVVGAFNSVAAVTEENTAATEELAAGTEQVTAVIHQMASIAQESAAATEEVSYAIDSLTGSAAEVARGARDLEQVARSLQQQVAKFTL